MQLQKQETEPPAPAILLTALVMASFLHSLDPHFPVWGSGPPGCLGGTEMVAS